MQRISKLALAAVLTTGTLLGTGATTTVSAKPATQAARHATHGKFSKKLFGFSSTVECDGDGGAGMVTRFCGIAIYRGGTVPNSNLCN